MNTLRQFHHISIIQKEIGVEKFVEGKLLGSVASILVPFRIVEICGISQLEAEVGIQRSSSTEDQRPFQNRNKNLGKSG